MAENQQQHHVTPLWVYLGVGGALLVLTVVTVAVAKVDFGVLVGVSSLNIIVAMIIASIKAILVALFFMHLIYDAKINMAVFITALLFLGVFIGLTMFDTVRRADVYELEEGPIKPKAKIYQNQ